MIRGSPYDDDVFQVTRLIEAFQAAEDQPAARIWGGSNMAAGSDSELGSSLPWTRLRDIAEPIVGAAWRTNQPDTPLRAEHPNVLLVRRAGEGADLQGVLEECGAEVSRVFSCGEASRALRAGSRFHSAFVLGAACRSDPDYAALLAAARRAEGVPVILCVTQTDGGWIDLLETGPAALLKRPFRHSQVRRLLDSLPPVVSHKGACELAAADR